MIPVAAPIGVRVSLPAIEEAGVAAELASLRGRLLSLVAGGAG